MGKPSRRWVRVGSRVAQGALGAVLALCITELVLRSRDGGAFPHFNGYVADTALALRMEPGHEQRFQFRDNPSSDIRINAAGYRGADWPAPGPGGDEILVVGDSQVFGLGVEEDETFSAELARLTGRPVINAGVPTYGPLEYNKVAIEIGTERKPKTIVYVVNFANDLFEWDRPNTERHALWDGWAVRVETVPSEVTSFPGRRWLMSRSHTVYALRRWLHGDDKSLSNVGLPSEGSWRDLIVLGEETLSAQESAEKAQEAHQLARAGRIERLEKLDSEIEGLSEHIVQSASTETAARLASSLSSSSADIVLEEGSEEGRYIYVTADNLHRAAELRNRAYRRVAALNGVEQAAELGQKLGERDALLGEMSKDLREARDAFVPSVLTPRIEEARQAAESMGAELVVVALPMDVQVDAGEWKKYGVTEGADMEPTLVFVRDLVATARRMGLRSLDATEALRGADKPTFLDGDIHMTAKGHKALAAALAQTLSEAEPELLPMPGLPEGRTYPPESGLWEAQKEIHVKNSTAARCATVRIAEWLRVSCYPDRHFFETEDESLLRGRSYATGLTIVRATPRVRLDTRVSVFSGGAVLQTPLLPGDDFEARFSWNREERTLSITWEGDEPVIAFSAAQKAVHRLEPASAKAEQLCRCMRNSSGRWWCPDLAGAEDEDCFESHPQCHELLACHAGEPDAQPRCPRGSVNAGATGRCRVRCDEGHPCDEGQECTTWRGVGVCI